MSITGPSGQNVSKPLARVHCPSRCLQVARGDVVRDRVPEDHVRGIRLGDVLRDAPDDDRDLALVLDALALRGSTIASPGPMTECSASGRAAARPAPRRPSRRRARGSSCRRRPPWSAGSPARAAWPRRAAPAPPSARTRRTSGRPSARRARPPPRRRCRRRWSRRGRSARSSCDQPIGPTVRCRLGSAACRGSPHGRARSRASGTSRSRPGSSTAPAG